MGLRMDTSMVAGRVIHMLGEEGEKRGLAGLRAVRERRKLSLRRLEALSGVAVSTIRDLEHGTRKAQGTTRWRLAEALGVEPEVLSGEREFLPEPPARPLGETPPFGRKHLKMAYGTYQELVRGVAQAQGRSEKEVRQEIEREVEEAEATSLFPRSALELKDGSDRGRFDFTGWVSGDYFGKPRDDGPPTIDDSEQVAADVLRERTVPGR